MVSPSQKHSFDSDTTIKYDMPYPLLVVDANNEELQIADYVLIDWSHTTHKDGNLPQHGHIQEICSNNTCTIRFNLTHDGSEFIPNSSCIISAHVNPSHVTLVHRPTSDELSKHLFTITSVPPNISQQHEQENPTTSTNTTEENNEINPNVEDQNLKNPSHNNDQHPPPFIYHSNGSSSRRSEEESSDESISSQNESYCESLGFSIEGSAWDPECNSFC